LWSITETAGRCPASNGAPERAGCARDGWSAFYARRPAGRLERDESREEESERRPGHGAFSEFRTGLDHIAFAVSSRDELEAWQDRLAEKGIPFSPIAESPIGTLVVLRDPDNIQLEFWPPLGQ
jgi:catechol 2,3-dioxygenase-like lactoylglutathione lyase family enzyme